MIWLALFLCSPFLMAFALWCVLYVKARRRRRILSSGVGSVPMHELLADECDLVVRPGSATAEELAEFTAQVQKIRRMHGKASARIRVELDDENL